MPFYTTLVVNMFQIQNWRLYGDSKWPPNMFILLKLGLNIFKNSIKSAKWSHLSFENVIDFLKISLSPQLGLLKCFISKMAPI